jgi:hypothetical protein
MRGGRPEEDVVAEATVEGPPRRKASWSLKTIVEDVAGRPIDELQDPERPLHPYLEGKLAHRPTRATTARAPAEPLADETSIDRVYPPLAGPTGRAFHGPAHEHHAETLQRHAVGAGGGPSRAPERLYLHYLLLHLDRVPDSGLRYLTRQIEEELAHRARARAEAGARDPAVGP